MTILEQIQAAEKLERDAFLLGSTCYSAGDRNISPYPEGSQLAKRFDQGWRLGRAGERIAASET